MGIGLFAGLIDRMRHAVHLCRTAPVKRWQRPVVAQRVSRSIVRALHEINASDVFPPANNLTNEPLHGIDWRMTCPPFGLSGMAYLKWV